MIGLTGSCMLRCRANIDHRTALTKETKAARYEKLRRTLLRIGYTGHLSLSIKWPRAHAARHQTLVTIQHGRQLQKC